MTSKIRKLNLGKFCISIPPHKYIINYVIIDGFAFALKQELKAQSALLLILQLPKAEWSIADRCLGISILPNTK